MATITFIAQGVNASINTLSGSGLGFYGSAGFGASVAVGAYQANTYVTDATGTLLGPQCHNIQYQNASSGVVDTATSGIAITAIPNFQAPLNIRFTHNSPVKVQNAKVYIFDRTNINNAASGVTTQVAEIKHPTVTQTNNGSGSTGWVGFDQSIAYSVGSGMPFSAGPGTSGLSPNGINTTDVQHDWYVAISQSPDTIGSKTLNGLYFYTEYL